MAGKNGGGYPEPREPALWQKRREESLQSVGEYRGGWVATTGRSGLKRSD